ncbi:MAG TPA: gas vesicle protein [Methanosarcinales archaeon]|nr:gas vesicle protein [Methanosarcinales archaeon]
MKPARENDLVDLLDRLLNKGLILNADLIISVAGVPLIGVNLKAALASIETMLDYGMMEAWDQNTREWYSKEYAKKANVPLMEGEDVFHRAFGSIWYSHGIINRWRPGFWHLTNRRLFLWRKDPAEMLFETPLDRIEAIMIRTDTCFKKEREVLALQLERGEVARIHVSDILGFKGAIEKSAAKRLEKRIEKEYAVVVA